MSALTVQAQKYEVGQIVPQGTWNALVVYVDETGEHGYLISPGAFIEGNLFTNATIVSYFYERGEEIKNIKEKMSELPIPIMQKGVSDNKIRKVMKDMIALNQNGTNGEENCQNITNYCHENGISIETYFPEISWATSLGEGWFIPGTEELEIYSKVIANGVGKSNYTGMHADDHRQELNRTLHPKRRVEDNPSGNNDFLFLFFPSTVCSSTFANNLTFEKNPDNKDKIATINGLGFRNIKSLYYGLTIFRDDLGLGHNWYIFNNKGIDYQYYVFAFKKF